MGTMARKGRWTPKISVTVLQIKADKLVPTGAESGLKQIKANSVSILGTG